MNVVRWNGLDIAYERAGEGPPLVLVHAGASDSRMWRPQLDALAGEFTIVAWDEPGAGRSSDLPADFTLADYADALAAVIEAVGLGPAHVAGLSWGGTLVLELYRRRPELVASLILADTYAGWKGSLPAEEVQRRATARGPAVPGLFAGDPPPELAALVEAMDADVRPDSITTALREMAAADQRDVLPHITVPTLLVWGAHDVRSPLTVAHQFQQAIPHAVLVVIPDAGHLSNLEQPDAFNDAIRAHVAR